MRTIRFLVIAALASAACGSEKSSGVALTDEDERGSVGVPPTAAEYCTRLGFTLTDSDCTFPDGTKCEQWSFYRGACGQSHSYCAQHGGSIASKTEDMGGWTAVYGECTLNGTQCQEGSFIASGKCEP